MSIARELSILRDYVKTEIVCDLYSYVRVRELNHGAVFKHDGEVGYIPNFIYYIE